jgi:hypothetical protein
MFAIQKISYLLTFPMLYVLGKLTIWPLKTTRDPTISVCVFNQEIGVVTDEACVTLQEKTQKACFASLLSYLLQIRNPAHVSLFITLSDAQQKPTLEATLKNMNFTHYTVSTS